MQFAPVTMTQQETYPRMSKTNEGPRTSGSSSGAGTRAVTGVSSSATPSAPRNQKKILVVDDEQDLLDLISYNLQRNGYDVVPASSGSDVLELAAREEPDLILLDLMLPGVDGTEVARRLKTDSRTA